MVVHDLELGSSGQYTCEVSSEAPRFKTVDATSHMRVIDLPDSQPILRHNLDLSKMRGVEGEPGYRVGETLEVNCTSPRSQPAAKLQWYLNNAPVRKLVSSFTLLLQTVGKNHCHIGRFIASR